jgi:hypothetical protein
MCLLIAEIGLLIGGLIALFTGKIPDFIFGKKASDGYTLPSMNARIIGGILMAPLPIALVLGFLLGLLFGEDLLFLGTLIEIFLVLGAVVGGLVLYRVWRQPVVPAEVGQPMV